MVNIYDYFNSRDIAEHCRSTNYSFSAIEMAYLVWRSNHHTLEDKHTAWREIIDTMPDETFHHNWDFDDHTLHSFLRTYMRLQNEFINDFCTTKKGYIFTYSVRYKKDACFGPEDIFFDSYGACLNALKVNELDDDTYDEIAKVRITRHKLYSSYVSYREAQQEESIILDKQLRIVALDPAVASEGEGRYLGLSYGFFEMWIAIPTPFRKGDIVIDVDTHEEYSEKHLPFILESIPYWRKNADNGEDCEERIEHLLELGFDWTDMQEGVYFQDSNGEIYWDHAFHYLDLEYYRGELEGTKRFLLAVSNAIQGKISHEDLLRSHSLILMGQYTLEARKYFGDNQDLLQLCGMGENDPVD